MKYPAIYSIILLFITIHLTHAQIDSAQSLSRQGHKAIREKNYHKADSLFSEAIKLDMQPSYYYFRGASRNKLKDVCMACEDFAKAASLNYDDGKFDFYDYCGRTDTVFYNRFSKACKRDSARSIEITYHAKPCNKDFKHHVDKYFLPFATNTFFADSNEVLPVVDSMPKYVGGGNAYAHFITKNINVPHVVYTRSLKGKVYVKFVITNTGEVKDIEIIKPMKDCYECGIEVVKLFRTMPKWIPGTVNGKPVSVQLTLPIGFTDLGTQY